MGLVDELREMKRTQTYLLIVIIIMTLRDMNAFGITQKLLILLINVATYGIASIFNPFII